MPRVCANPISEFVVVVVAARPQQVNESSLCVCVCRSQARSLACSECGSLDGVDGNGQRPGESDDNMLRVEGCGARLSLLV